MENATTPANKATNTMTTRISIRVKPVCLLVPTIVLWPCRNKLLKVPVTDVGIVFLAAILTIGAKGIQIEGAIGTGRYILVIVPPGILGQRFNVAALVPVFWLGKAGRLFDQSLQSLLSTWIAMVIQAVHVERVGQITDILFGDRDAGLIRLPQNVGGHGRDEQRQDNHHHHDLN